MVTAHPAPRRGALSDRILDLLDIHGALMSTKAIAARLGVGHRVADKTLQRLRTRGWVDRRLIADGAARPAAWWWITAAGRTAFDRLRQGGAA